MATIVLSMLKITGGRKVFEKLAPDQGVASSNLVPCTLYVKFLAFRGLLGQVYLFISFSKKKKKKLKPIHFIWIITSAVKCMQHRLIFKQTIN